MKSQKAKQEKVYGISFPNTIQNPQETLEAFLSRKMNMTKQRSFKSS